MAKIGLVTVLFNSDEVLGGFLKSISAQTHKDYILYLIDNSPSEKTTNVIANFTQKYPITDFRHIISNENIGVAAGNNVGINLSLNDNCDYILLLNNDIEFEQNFIFERLLNLCKNEAGMIVPKIFYYGSDKIWMAGGYMDKWRALGVHYGMGQTDKPEFNQQRFITYAPTCFMLIDKKVFGVTGVMDEAYFAYYDDTDFVIRAISKGFKLLYDPKVSIYHKVSFSSGSGSLFYIYYSNRNKIYFARKNLTGIQKYFSILYTVLVRTIFWIRFNREEKRKLVKAISDGFKMKINYD